MWHHKEKLAPFKYNCTQCPYSTNTASNFKRHSGVHKSSQPYECHICGNRFATFKSLSVHVVIHTGENLPFHSLR
ncbi:Zinc finger protein 480, partial [Stegodyphus mimosarum]